MDGLYQSVPDDWKDKGLGYYSNRKTQTYYRVLQWDAANEFREELGLGHASFHITVGFHPNDIHGVVKDESTLKK